jgi:hypothetical protein
MSINWACKSKETNLMDKNKLTIKSDIIFQKDLERQKRMFYGASIGNK